MTAPARRPGPTPAHRSRLGIAAAVALLASTPAAGACFWTVPRNLALPETNTLYWRAEFRLERGERLALAGDFPHARQMSFALHRASDNAGVAAARDVDLEPVAGAANPYRPGSRRDAVRRGFSVEIDPWAAAAPGRLGGGVAGQGAFDGRLLYRIYLADRSKPGGGVALPRVWKVAPDGVRTPLGGDCPDPRTVDMRQTLGPTRIPPGPGAVTDPIEWRGSAAAPGSSGDLLVNRDNAYAYALTSFARGELLVLSGIAPTHPRTLGGARRMGVGQVRYWSICAYRHPSDRSAACVADEAIPLARDRRYTIVIGPAARRPSNARPDCGVAWIDAPADGDGAVLLRHVAPDPGFANTPLNITPDQLARDVLGPFEPVGRYLTRSQFEARGCRGGR